MSDPTFMVLGIVLIVTVGGIFRAKYGLGRRGRSDQPVGNAANDAETKALLAEIRALKDRIQVLERIATDGNRAASLDQEIEKLRDRSIP